MSHTLKHCAAGTRVLDDLPETIYLFRSLLEIILGIEMNSYWKITIHSVFKGIDSSVNFQFREMRSVQFAAQTKINSN